MGGRVPGAHVPRRRCVGCGRVASKPELIRLAVITPAGENRPQAVLDRGGTAPGRGAYVCRAELEDGPNRDCVRLATRRGALRRAFRRNVELSAELVESESR